MASDHLTIGQIATIYGLPDWRIRRVVDSIGVEIPRVGLYRLVPRTLLGTIALELTKRGWLPEQEAAR